MDGDLMEMLIPFLGIGATCKWAVFLTLQRKKFFDFEETGFHRISVTWPSFTRCQHPKRRMTSKSNLHHILTNKIPKCTVHLSSGLTPRNYIPEELLLWRERHWVSPNCWCLSTNLQSVIARKITICIFTIALTLALQ